MAIDVDEPEDTNPAEEHDESPVIEAETIADQTVLDISSEATATAMAAASAAMASVAKAASRAQTKEQERSQSALLAVNALAAESNIAVEEMLLATTRAAKKAADARKQSPTGNDVRDLKADAAETAREMVVAAAKAATRTLARADNVARAAVEAASTSASEMAADAADTASEMIIAATAAAAAVVVTAADAAEAAEYAQGLERDRAEANRASGAKSDFLSSLSHELRSPLGVILGFTSIMIEEQNGLQPQYQAMVSRMDRSGRHLLRLVDDLRDISTIESGRASMSIEVVSLKETVDQAIDVTSQLASERSIALTVNVDASIKVLADPFRLEQVVVNLLSNAAKYNRNGGFITVRAINENSSVRLEISDTGVGIDSTKIDELFKPFARLGAELSDIEGTGLGLALSRALVEQMGGSIELVETGTAGTTFAAVLPSST